MEGIILRKLNVKMGILSQEITYVLKPTAAGLVENVGGPGPWPDTTEKKLTEN